MRKVKVYKLKIIPENYCPRYLWRSKKIEDFTGEFHQWGSDYEVSSEDGSIGNAIIAIVEREDGTIATPRPSMIQFLDRVKGN